MRKIFKPWFYGKTIMVAATLIVLIIMGQLRAHAQSVTPMRRPISPEQPMWLVHIDTWNWPDPQKIIDLIPKDIRPYVVMNISLSISHNDAGWNIVEYGYETAKSWLRTCAENQMWAMIQPSSGGYCHFSDFDLSVYEEFYQDYPNFIGFNYCEQFWGFDDPPLSVTWSERVAHWVDLMKLNHKYGGYLTVSWCGGRYAAGLNPIAMMKRNPEFAAICQQHPENFILCEKYTSGTRFQDIESLCLGTYLSGYSGQYGIRFDHGGWKDANGEEGNYPTASGAIPHLEHIMFTGETVIDGPELIWVQCFHEGNKAQTPDGYTVRQWETFPQFDNISIDIFRKILDGTIRIMSRREVMDRTKLVIVNDVNSGSTAEMYSTPETLFEGLYRMDDDGNYDDNLSWFKKTGRYPSIPTVYQLADTNAQSFQVQVNKSAYAARWPDISDKVNEFNTLFPEEYTGDLYAGRHENGWVTYNPFKTGQTASASIPFKYNTCDHLELIYSQYSSGVIKEFSDKLSFYLTNYDANNSDLKTDTIRIYGSSSEPTYSYTDRASHLASTVTSSYSGGVFVLNVTHNGPLDITVNCSGTATGRLTSYTAATVIAPELPALYTGPRQYEAECFDYKDIARNFTNGVNSGIHNYTGQGFMEFGANSAASIRDTIYALRAGNYQLRTKYIATGGTVNSIDLYVNGIKVSTPAFSITDADSSWNVNTQAISLNAGKNVIMFKANTAGSYNILFDHIVITQGASNNVYNFTFDNASTGATTPAAELVSVKSGTAGVVSYADNSSLTSNCFKSYSAGATNGTGIADLDMFSPGAANYSVVWKEYYSTTGAKKGVLLRGYGNNGSCTYADGMKQGYLFIVQNNNDNTITLKPYVAGASGLTSRQTYTTSFKVMPGEPCWFRTSALGHKLKFECSDDSVNWVGGPSTTYTDSTYLSGSTELVWGMNSDNFSWVMDNITYLSGHISVSKFSLDGFGYTQGKGPSYGQSFKVSGGSLTDDIVINSPDGYEMSLSTGTGYSSSLILSRIGDSISTTTVYVRMKSGLSVGEYNGAVSVSSNGLDSCSISVEGEVSPLPMSRQYDFTSDIATTGASTPPALNTAIGQGNDATAGVVSFTDANNETSNMFRPYSSGQRNATGAVDLDLFSKVGTDYSVTWKQYVGSDNDNYKTGVLLRGDTAAFGDESTGYVQGIMQGYLFIVYTVGTEDRSEFRIYHSTSAYNTLDMMVNGYISLSPATGQPVWYRATVSGSSSVSLVFEYSTDSIDWKIGSSTTDPSPMFTAGATQIVWGLGVGNVDFYMDNITFYGLDANSGTQQGIISSSETSLNGFNYIVGSGPSEYQSFNVSGSLLLDTVWITAPDYFEVSFSSDKDYAPSIALSQRNGVAVETPVYVRLKSDLTVNTYEGDILITSNGSVSQGVSLSGSVIQESLVNDIPDSPVTVISIWYYTITGQEVPDIENFTGIFIVRKLLSDGTVSSYKILKK